MDGNRVSGAVRTTAVGFLVTLLIAVGCGGDPSGASKPAGRVVSGRLGFTAIEKFIVKFKDQNSGFSGVPAARVETDVSYLERNLKAGSSIKPIADHLYHVVLPEKADPKTVQEELGHGEHVEYIEPDYPVYALYVPNDPQYAEQYAHQLVQSEKAWDIGQGSSEVIVAEIDSGIDFSHPDLKSNMWKNPGEKAGNGKDDDGNGLVDDVYGWDFANNDSDPTADDQATHGTHVAGIIGAVGNNGAGVVGHSPKVKLMALKFLSANGAGDTSAAIRAIDYAIKNGAHILSNSWGGYDSSRALQEAVDRARRAGILFVAAAGNGGYDGWGDDNDAYPTYPASFPLDNIVAVAATDASDALTYYSNFGRNSVHVAAPGDQILSTLGGGQYGQLSGTSMATPAVSGVAALIKALKPELSYSKIKKILIATADKLPSLSGRVVSGGRVNAYKAMKAAKEGGVSDDEPIPEPEEPEPTPPPPGEPGGGVAQAPLIFGQPQVRVQSPYQWIVVDYDVMQFEGAAGVYFEISQPNQPFSNPNAMEPDPTRLLYAYGYGAQNRFVFSPIQYLPGWGTYFMRVIPLDASGRALGLFSDAAVLDLYP